MWTTTFAELARTTVLDDGSLFLQMAPTQESLSFYKITGPGQMQSLGNSPRPLRQVSVTKDMKHATALERDYRADAWMSKVHTHD